MLKQKKTKENPYLKKEIGRKHNSNTTTEVKPSDAIKCEWNIFIIRQRFSDGVQKQCSTIVYIFYKRHNREEISIYISANPDRRHIINKVEPQATTFIRWHW